ncbi:MAG: NUDIX hydrolase [Proteobacteria bacterium]|nr:NUDIX hydrolase [Pseudomonadota bacterium]
MNFCTQCGSATKIEIPQGDDRERDVCTKCGFIHYFNPRLVVGTIPIWEDKILIVKRAIEPCYGRWTLPAGYLENGESVLDGALRETREEANARIENLQSFGLFNMTQINQIYYMFYGQLSDTNFDAGAESLEVKLVKEEDVPWDEIAFKVIRVTLERFFEDRRKGSFDYHMENIYFERSIKHRS